MASKLRNIIEDIARDYLNSALTLRYDICTCPACKNDMLAYILSRVPAKYVTTEEGALHTVIQQSRVEHQAVIGRVIIEAIEVISKNPRHKLKEDKNKVFSLLLETIKENRGLDFTHYHQELLKRRIAIRLRANRMETYSEYLRYLINNPEEYDKLFATLCINVSEFFRDPEVWKKIRQILKNIVEDKIKSSNPYICIWSAGCADGEEPYSIAILLKEILKDKTYNLHIDISGTDVDKKSLAFAQEAIYEKNLIKNVDKELLDKYFEPQDNCWRVKKEIRSMVNFYYLDLTGQEYKKNVDVIFCRNVFIYFDRGLQEQILMKFYNALRNDGYLVMGKSETLISEAKHIFSEVDLDCRIFRKKEVNSITSP
ncbi:MAG: late competence development ComFB family protein [Candidatus Omnitrophica bacterium]|nr:late competence development ComFB family protein [Candidatus Omnitrophota bacterium]